MRFFFVLLAGTSIVFTNSAKAEDTRIVLATDAIQPHLTIDNEGGIYVVFIHNGNIAVTTSADRGKSFSQPTVAIDAKGLAKGGMHRGPRIGVDSQKRITVTCPLVLDEAENRKKYPTAELVVVSSRDGGRSWTRPIQVNEVSKQAPEALHWMSVAPSGEAHIAWLDRRERTEPGQDLFYARFVDGKIEKNRRIASLVCECCAPGLAVDKDGNPIVIFREGGIKPSREIFAVSSTDKGEHFSLPMQINQSPTREKGCPMSAPAIVVSPDGKQLTAAWKDMRTGQAQIQWASSDAASFAADSPVHKEDRSRQDHPSMTRESNGTIWIAWEEKTGSTQQIWVRSAAPNDPGRALSDLGEGPASFPVISSKGGLTGVVYEGKKNGKSAVFYRVLKDS